MSETTRRAVITGATGYVGAHLTSRLIGEGWDVMAMVRDRAAAAVRLPGAVALVEYGSGLEESSSALARFRPAVAFHLASRYVAEHRPSDVSSLVRSNVELGALVMEALSASTCRNVVTAGTSWQHTAGQPDVPASLYAATKTAIEPVLRYYASARGFHVSALKLYDTYGPDDPRPKLIPLLLQALATDVEVLLSPGDQIIHLVYVDDVVTAFTTAAEMLLEGEAAEYVSHTVPSDHPLSLKDLVATLGRVSGKDVPVLWGGRPYRDREVMVPWTGTPLPRWRPSVGLEEGLANVVAAHRRSHRW